MARSNNATSSVYARNTSVSPLKSTGGPFTIAFWFKAGSTATTNKYLFTSYYEDGIQHDHGVIYEYTADQVEFYSSQYTGTNPRTGAGVTISDTNWHHIAYRKQASGTSAWDKFLDGAKTSINASIAFTLGGTATNNGFVVGTDPTLAVWMDAALAEIVVDDIAYSDEEIAALAKGYSPALLRKGTTKYYWPLIGQQSPEPELYTGAGLTITGAFNAAAHPPVRYGARSTLGLVGGTAVTYRNAGVPFTGGGWLQPPNGRR